MFVYVDLFPKLDNILVKMSQNEKNNINFVLYAKNHPHRSGARTGEYVLKEYKHTLY